MAVSQTTKGLGADRTWRTLRMGSEPQIRISSKVLDSHGLPSEEILIESILLSIGYADTSETLPSIRLPIVCCFDPR